jgi:gliding motility-associated-like protein
VNDVASVNYSEILTSNINSNDNVPAGTSYGTPVGSSSNPSNTLPVVNTDGTYTFSALKPGVYIFNIPVCAPGQINACPVETLTITVINNRTTNTTPPPPVLVADVNVTSINVPVKGNLSTNDSLQTGTTYGAATAATTNPTGGVITISPNGTYTFTATNPGKYIYYIPVCPISQYIDCPISTLEITVVDPLLNTNNPVANNDIAATNAGTPVNINILANDKSANNGIGLNIDSLKITIVPTNGTAVINNDGTIKFTPKAGFIGTDSLTYKICDSASPANCQVAMVYFTVNATGIAPITSAADDYASIAATANGTNSVSGNILTNDVNTGTLTLTATVLNGPTAAQGKFTLTADGKYTFTPAPGFSGPVDITYQACDNASPAKCVAATLHILVTPATVITPDINVTAIKVPVGGSLTTNDKIPAGSFYGTPNAASTNLAGAVITISPNGTYTFTATASGKYIYYVPICANGQTTGCPLSPLEITVLDPFSNTNLPVVNNDLAATKVGTPVTTNVLANDKKSNINTQLDTTSLKISTAPANGTAIVNADGTITYTPAANFVGTDSLVYTVCDNVKPANCQTAVVYYTVLPIFANIVNALTDDYASVNGAVKNTTNVLGNVLLNDKSTAGASLTASLVAGPTAAQGSFTINADGSYTFTPTAGFTGPISIVYKACDNASPANCALATLHILVNPYYKLVNDTATQTVEKLINGNLATNDTAPNASYGTPIADANNLKGASFILNSNGTYSFIATQPGIYKYTYPVCKLGQITNCDSATIVFNITYLPQGAIYLKYPTLLQADSVHLVFNFTAGVGPFKLVVLNSLTNKKDTLYNVTDSADIIVAPSKDDTKFTLLSITDSKNVGRDFNITKDTTNLNILKPQILLTLKAELPNKLPDNSFKTKILMKIKNNGEINLQDVQVNADLSKVFPSDMRFSLDSFKVTYGNLKLNPSYTGFGSTIKPRYITKVENGFSITYRSQSVLSGTDLFDYGVKLNIAEEGDVVFYLTLIPGKTLDPLVFQFAGVGNGLLVQNDGKKSMDTATSLSHDNSNLLAHPDLTGVGKALPTFVPLFLVSEIGAALQGSKADTVLGGYNFHYSSVIKNYSNSNLDSVFAYYNLRKAFPSPDTASIIGVPKVTGTITLNPKYDGVTDTAILNGIGSLKVGDSIVIKYDVFVKTKKAQYSWPSYLLTKGRTTTGDISVSDSSTNGLNPDPNKDSIPNEHIPTIVQVGYNPPVVPTLVSNVIYNVGDSLNPKNIGGLIKSVPQNAIPTWCDVSGISCYSGVPSLPNKPGVYIYCVKSLDTLTGLTSSPCVMDTVTMLPVVKVKNDTLMSNVITNPKNIVYLIKTITPGSTPIWCDVNGNNCTKVAPSVPTIPGKYIWCVKAVDSATNLTSANCKMDTLTILDPYNILDITKQVTGITMNPDGSYLIGFVIRVQNKTNTSIDSVYIKDDLTSTFKTNKGFDIANLTASGGLVKNISYDGFVNIDLVTKASILAANKIDSINLTILIHSADINGDYVNISSIISNTSYGKLGLVSNDPILNPNNYLNRLPTAFIVPKIDVIVPGGFSPNNDGFDDAWIIKRPFGTKITVRVFNRWGNEVYSSPDYKNDWRGKGVSNFMGEDVVEGTYFYVVEAVDMDGAIRKFAGSLTIVR